MKKFISSHFYKKYILKLKNLNKNLKMNYDSFHTHLPYIYLILNILKSQII
jgi:hypothetical protein